MRPADMMSPKAVLAGLALLGVSITGCQTGPFREYRSEECVDVEPGSPGWWKTKSNAPIGARQKYSKDRYWPPFPRHDGERAQLTHQFHGTHYWPHPYNCQDRAAVEAHINAQTLAGWREATTLYEYDFDAKTNQLTAAGQRKLLWIMRHTPPQYRTAFVQADIKPDISNARLATVKNKAVEFAGDESLAIQLRTADPFGRAAEELSRFRNLELNSMPAPRIPLDLGSGSTSNSGGGTGNGAGGGGGGGGN